MERSADPVLLQLSDELQSYPAPAASNARRGSVRADFAGIAVPLELRTAAGVLSFLSTTTVFGTPIDVSLSELAIESFFPANADTAAAMQRLAEQRELDGSDAGISIARS